MNLAGNVLHAIEEEQKKARIAQLKALPKTFASDLDMHKAEDGKILISELSKMLFLNSQDPKKYSAEFFALYFNIEPQKIKNIVNYVGFPIIDEENGKIGKILRFVHV